ncbi:Uncharacterised protein [Chryseobacterium indoltheticum]|uniref:Uncharacterized protein n=1 Tax=Chryseobacterium indoltheticum TaxID=254 RepID=A0A381FEM7_9FLAO|nr:Uncharacterised protein [Chryseobacterium indoltheticum]
MLAIPTLQPDLSGALLPKRSVGKKRERKADKAAIKKSVFLKTLSNLKLNKVKNAAEKTAYHLYFKISLQTNQVFIGINDRLNFIGNEFFRLNWCKPDKVFRI